MRWIPDRSLVAGPVGYVALGQFVTVFGSGVVYPFAVLYFVDEVGIAFTLVGAGLLVNNLAMGVGTGLGGYLADRLGRRRVMVASMGLSAVALAAYALVTTAAGFVVVAGAAGLVGGLYSPASHALIADVTAEAREEAFGLLKVASNAGFGSGFVAGGVLFGIAHTAVFVVDGLTSAVVAAVLLLGLPRRRPPGVGGGLGEDLTRWSRAVGEPRLLQLALLNVAFAVLYAQMQSTVPVFASRSLGLSSEALGTLYVLNPAVIVLLQFPAISAISRWRRTRGLLLSTGFWAAAFLAVAVAGAVPVAVGIALLAAFLVLRTVGEVLHAPLVAALASDLGPPATRGSQLSAIEIAKRVGFGIGPVVGGAFFDAGHEALLWVALVGLCGLVGLGLLGLETRVSPAENGRP